MDPLLLRQIAGARVFDKTPVFDDRTSNAGAEVYACHTLRTIVGPEVQLPTEKI